MKTFLILRFLVFLLYFTKPLNIKKCNFFFTWQSKCKLDFPCDSPVQTFGLNRRTECRLTYRLHPLSKKERQVCLFLKTGRSLPWTTWLLLTTVYPFLHRVTHEMRAKSGLGSLWRKMNGFLCCDWNGKHRQRTHLLPERLDCLSVIPGTYS